MVVMKKMIFGIGLVTNIFMNAQTQIIAHRGFWKTNPETTENSIKSLENTQKLGIYGSEFDVRMTKDGYLVVNHDEHHGGMTIADTNYAELEKVKLSNGENFPTLAEYLLQGKKVAGVKLIVEIKPAANKVLEDALVEKTLKTIKDMQLEPQCEFISFSLNICKEIKKVDSRLKVQYLNGDLSPEEIKKEGIDGIDYHYNVFKKNPTWLAEAKKLGLITNAWTVNDVKVFDDLKMQGIGFVTTNIPDVLKTR